MTVREFDGTDDTIRCAAGAALEAMTFGTAAMIVKPATIAAGTRSWGSLHSSGGAVRAILLTTTSTATMWDGNDFSPMSGYSFPAANRWYLIVARKPTGVELPRYSVYDFVTDGWAHGDGVFTNHDYTAAGAGGTIRTDDEGSDLPAGRLAVRAVWANEVHWAADATGDAALEALDLEAELQTWVDQGPDALWTFDQASTADPVLDLIGDADQTSIVGTTVVVGDDPPGFNFTLGGGGSEIGRTWNGSAWVADTAVKVHNGSAWVAASSKVHNGSAWVAA